MLHLHDLPLEQTGHPDGAISFSPQPAAQLGTWGAARVWMLRMHSRVIVTSMQRKVATRPLGRLLWLLAARHIAHTNPMNITKKAASHPCW